MYKHIFSEALKEEPKGGDSLSVIDESGVETNSGIHWELEQSLVKLDSDKEFILKILQKSGLGEEYLKYFDL